MNVGAMDWPGAGLSAGSVTAEESGCYDAPIGDGSRPLLVVHLSHKGRI